MKTIDIIHEEHRPMTAALHALRFLVGEFHTGKPKPEFRLLTAKVEQLNRLFAPETLVNSGLV
ncbi:MAG: hypothetical protein NTY41_15505 [Proteobacteria bacterium]|nr:hypothetical protein [Pseudomonadota bacterium]